MKSFKFILIILLLFIVLDIKADSTLQVLKPLRKKHNIIEYSLNSLNLFDGQGYKLTEPRFNVSYTRFIYKQYFVKIEYFEYARINQINDNKTSFDSKRGDVDFTNFEFVRMNIGKQFRCKNFVIQPSISANYRWGFGEHYFWDIRQGGWGGPIFNSNKMKSLGIGTGVNIGYHINQYFIVSIEGNYAYNFEKYNFEFKGEVTKEDSDAFNFKPNRKYSTLQFKLGYKF